MILLCALMVGLAFSPSATEKLADMLYGENQNEGIVDTPKYCVRKVSILPRF